MHPFRKAIEARDMESAIACLAPEVELHSPFAFRPFVGKESVSAVLRAVLEVLEDFRYTDELRADDDRTHALVFRARIGETSLEGLDIVRSSRDDGRIDCFTVMIRPANALMAMGAAMGPKVSDLAKGGKPQRESAGG